MTGRGFGARRRPAPQMSLELAADQPAKGRSSTTGDRRGPSEKQISDDIVCVLRNKGWMVMRVNSGAMKRGNHYVRFYHVYGHGDDGFPDLLAMRGDLATGKTEALLLEVKREDGKLRPRQEAFIRFCRMFGIVVHVFRDPIEVMDFVNAL